MLYVDIVELNKKNKNKTGNSYSIKQVYVNLDTVAVEVTYEQASEKTKANLKIQQLLNAVVDGTIYVSNISKLKDWNGFTRVSNMPLSQKVMLMRKVQKEVTAYIDIVLSMNNEDAMTDRYLESIRDTMIAICNGTKSCNSISDKQLEQDRLKK